MSSLIRELFVWTAATLATWAISWSVTRPEACQDVPTCSKQLQSYPGLNPILPEVESCVSNNLIDQLIDKMGGTRSESDIFLENCCRLE